MTERAAKLFGILLAVFGMATTILFGWLAFKEPPVTLVSLSPCFLGVILLAVGCLTYPNTHVATALNIVVVTVRDSLPGWGRRSTDQPGPPSNG